MIKKEVFSHILTKTTPKNEKNAAFYRSIFLTLKCRVASEMLANRKLIVNQVLAKMQAYC